MRLENYDALWLLWLLPLLASLFAFSLYRKRRMLQRFAATELLNRLNLQMSTARQIFKALLLIVAAAAIIIALTQPAWNPRREKISRKGRDIVILLDVSRSMLAEDLKPNRLEQAKLAIGDLLDQLRGDRVGIIAFAGNSVIKCPLTQDYGFVRMVLADINVDSVTRGGTLIGDAIRKATDEVFDEQDRDFKDIILITDGEDHESLPVKAAEKAAQQNIRVFAIGLGNEQEGSRIPITTAAGEKTFLKYEGQEVWTHLDADLLRDIVFSTPGGQYVNVATGSFDLGELYKNLILSADRKQLEATTVARYDEKFQIFLVLALVLLVCEAMISERKKK